MKVEFLAAGDDHPYVLADFRDSFFGFRKRDISVYEMAHYLMATGLEPLDRGGRSFSVSFSVTRQHSAIYVAEAFVLTHANGLPSVGKLTLTAQQPAGNNIGVRKAFTCDKAVKVLCEGSFKGVQTTFNYEFMGGILA